MNYEVIEGDCLEVMRGMEAGSVNLIFADPPYNIGVDYGTGTVQDDLLPDMRYQSFLRDRMEEFPRVLSPTGAVWVLINEFNADWVGAYLSRGCELSRRARIIWRERFGQYRETTFANGHRHLFYHVNDIEHYTWNTADIRVASERMKMGDKRAVGPRVPDDVWDVSRVQGNCNERIKGHPCQLRRWPLERIIKACTNPGDTVLDPFCGIGTMGIVATQLGRRFIGIEISHEYCDMARKRIENPEPEPVVVDVEGQTTMEFGDA